MTLLLVCLPYVVVVLLCFATQAFFSGSEIALVSANRLQLREDARTKPGAVLVL